MQPRADDQASGLRRSEAGRLLLLLALACTYYIGVLIGLAFTPAASAVSLLWPPNAILLAALLLSPPRTWRWSLLAVLPPHLIAEVTAGVPVVMALSWYVSNVSEALLAAGLVYWFLGDAPRFDRIRDVVVYLVVAVFTAPVLTSFLDAAFVALVGWRYDGDYWQVFRTRLPSNVLAAIIVPPFAILMFRDGIQLLRNMSRARWLEAAALLAALTTISFLVFLAPKSQAEGAIWVYAPLPVLIWVAIRSNATGVSASMAVLTLISITGTLQGTGPFALAAAQISVLSLQIFLIITAVALMLLAAALDELRAAREAALHSKERLNLALSAAHIGTWEWSLVSDGITWHAPARAGEIVSRSVRSHAELLDLAHPSDRRRILATMRAARDRGEGCDMECRFKCDGDFRWVRALGRVQLDAADRPSVMIGVCIDTTQRKQLELQQRSQREKLRHLTLAATLGEISGALAHELSQPLAATLINVRVAEHEVRNAGGDPSLLAILADILADAERATEVINRLRVLASRHQAEREPVQVADCIHSILALEHSDLIARNVAVDLDIDSQLPPVRAAHVQLQQVLLNLIVNACEAMAGQSGQRRLRIAARHLSGEIRMEVTDNGSGVEDFERIFEPFFSSRKHGVGLGLAIARSIVAAHGGRLWGSNNAAGGATFYITLPVARDVVAVHELGTGMK